MPNVQYQSGNTKFFYGTVLTIEGMNYFVPISSKIHNRQDDIINTNDKFKSKSGTLRFMYMLPIPKKCLSFLDLSQVQNYTQKERIRKELAFCRRNKDKIEKQAKHTYERIANRINDDLVRSSCDFKLLEKAYREYCEMFGIK